MISDKFIVHICVGGQWDNLRFGEKCIQCVKDEQNASLKICSSLSNSFVFNDPFYGVISSYS